MYLRVLSFKYKKLSALGSEKAFKSNTEISSNAQLFQWQFGKLHFRAEIIIRIANGDVNFIFF